MLFIKRNESTPLSKSKPRSGSGFVDPSGWGPVRRPNHNARLNNNELRRRISERNKAGRPTFLLRREFDSRLDHRGNLVD